MKKLLLSILFVVAMVSMLFAQTPQMTYQAVIRDGNGQLLSNQPVEATVKVKVGESELFNQTYTETTNIHGLLTVTFGHADFATIDWANATISCEVKNGSAVYIAENFQPVTTVPLAIKAISESDPQFNASVAASITASDTLYWNHKLDAEVDGSVTNEIQVLSINKDTIKLSNGGFVKLPAVIDSTSLDDAYNHGHSITADDGPVTINGTDGFLSTGTIYSMGTIPVSGAGTRMMWYPPIAAFRAGYINGTQWDSDNVGQYSTAMGLNTTAKGQASTAMGCYTTASSFFTTAMGYNTTASGEASTTMGNFTTASGHYATAMGNYTIASGLYSTAMGHYTTASGIRSTAMGSHTKAIGDASTAMGYNTTASGDQSTAMGQGSKARGFLSTVIGLNSTANGMASTSIGVENYAQSYASVVLGRYNVVAGDSSNWVATDPLFVVGNGEFGTPSNALTVYKNGNMDVNGIVTATGGNSTNWNTAYSWGNHATAGYLAAEVDGSVTNEIQALSISKDTVYLSNGGFVKLPTADGAETIITAGTNVTVTGNGTTISPYVVNATVPTTLSIGQSYQGGIIFWLDATGQHGLIAATADQSTGVQWYNGTYRYTGTTGDGLYAGAMNTALIVATQMSDNQTGNFAAKVCADYSVTENGVTYGDWYLPSKYELNLLYFQKDMVFSFASANYWSSTESYNGGAWGQDFVDGSQIDIGKSNPSSVRAVRSF